MNLQENVQRESVMVVDASDLGLAPGVWPDVCVVDGGIRLRKVGPIHLKGVMNYEVLYVVDGTDNIVRVMND